MKWSPISPPALPMETQWKKVLGSVALVHDTEAKIVALPLPLGLVLQEEGSDTF